MAEDLTIKTEGVGELMQAFGRIDKGLRKELRTELVSIAGLVAVEAKKIAEAKGLNDTGKLIAKIRPGFRGAYAYVTDTANKAGFNYPAVYEGELSGHGLKGRGKRPFLGPAAEAKRAEAVAGFESLLDRLANQAGFARGGVL